MKNDYCTKQRMKIELRNENLISYPDTMVGLSQITKKKKKEKKNKNVLYTVTAFATLVQLKSWPLWFH